MPGIVDGVCRSYVRPVQVSRKPPLGITLVHLSYNKSDPRVLYDMNHPAPAAGVFTPSGEFSPGRCSH